MARIGDYKVMNNPTHDLLHSFDVVYDFSIDGGAVGSLDLFELNENCIVYAINIKVQSLTSGGAATVAFGPNAFDIIPATAYDDTVITNYGSLKFPLQLTEGTPNTGYALFPQAFDAGTILQLKIATAALTGGTMTFKVVLGKQ